jgi:transcriptional regulator with XRE-family HTH domain
VTRSLHRMSLLIVSAGAKKTTRRAFGARLRRYRENAGKTREEVAIRMGRSAGAVRDWELGQRSPNQMQIAKLARVYGVRVSDLAGSELVTGDA